MVSRSGVLSDACVFQCVHLVVTKKVLLWLMAGVASRQDYWVEHYNMGRTATYCSYLPASSYCKLASLSIWMHCTPLCHPFSCTARIRCAHPSLCALSKHATLCLYLIPTSWQ